MEVTAYLHIFVYNELLDCAAIAAACGPRVAALCTAYQEVLAERKEVAPRGKPRARQRVRHFVAAHQDPELGLLAMAALWARVQQVHDGEVSAVQRHSLSEDARQILVPYLEMLGMRTLREEVELWLWRQQEVDAARLAQVGEQIFDQVRGALAPALPTAVLVQRPPSAASIGRVTLGAVHQTARRPA